MQFDGVDVLPLCGRVSSSSPGERSGKLLNGASRPTIETIASLQLGATYGGQDRRIIGTHWTMGPPQTLLDTRALQIGTHWTMGPPRRYCRLPEYMLRSFLQAHRSRKPDLTSSTNQGIKYLGIRFLRANSVQKLDVTGSADQCIRLLSHRYLAYFHIGTYSAYIAVRSISPFRRLKPLSCRRLGDSSE